LQHISPFAPITQPADILCNSARRFQRIERVYGTNPSPEPSKSRNRRGSVDHNELRAKAAKKRKLIEGEEAGHTDVDDDEGFEHIAGGSNVSVKAEPRPVIKIEDDTIPNYGSHGWRGDAELMELYDAPETISKYEPDYNDSGSEESIPVYGTPCSGDKHGIYGSISYSSAQRQKTMAALQPPTNENLPDRRIFQERTMSLNNNLPRPLLMRYSSATEGLVENPVLID
jgi:hypothetical protein